MASWTDALDKRTIPFVSPVDGDAYPTESFLFLSRSEADDIRHASEALFSIFSKAVRAVLTEPKEILLRLGVPELLFPFLGKENALGLPSWISRFDFVRGTDGSLYMVELNADTPCAIPEAFYGNGVAADAFSLDDPNRGEYSHLCEFLSRIDAMTLHARKDVLGRMSFAPVFAFACFPSYEEDRCNTRFLQEALRGCSRASQTTFWDFSDIEVVEGEGVRVGSLYAHALYRLHPMELLAGETGKEGENLAWYLLREWEEGRVHLMNPPDAIVLQSKLFLALVYALTTETDFFSAGERERVRGSIPRSLFGEDVSLVGFPGKALGKPAFGREGSGIRMMEEMAWKRDSCLYQEFIESAPVRVETKKGSMIGYVTYSCFMLGEKASALYARVSGDVIAGSDAYWVPLLYRQ